MQQILARQFSDEILAQVSQKSQKNAGKRQI
jgi:hypothetical protein